MSKTVSHNGVEFRLDVHDWSPKAIFVSADARVIETAPGKEGKWGNLGFFTVRKDEDENTD